jgi:hypothetical protein
MNHNKKPALLFLLTCALGTSYAATLFQDNFQDSTATKANWIFPAAIKRQFTGNALTVQNTDSKFTWSVTHNFATKAPTFSLTASITFSSPAANDAGLGFCMKGTSGITLWLGTSQNIYVYKDNLLLFNKANSFINSTANTVAISKIDSVFTVFCNTIYIGSFICSDANYIAGGDIALVVGNNSSFQVSDLKMTDQPTTGAPKTAYNDNFTSGNTQGWYVTGLNGTVSVSSGALTVANSGVSPANPYISGNFNKASLRVIATHQQGDAYYGLAFYIFAPGPAGDTVKSYLFLINQARDYASGQPDSNSIYALQNSLVHGDKDTLEVLRFSNKYKFRINHALMPDSFPLLSPGRISAAGLYVGGKTTVSFEDFAVGGDSLGNFASIINFSKGHGNSFGPISRLAGNDFTVFDVRGRVIKHGTGNYLEALKKLPGGMYIMRTVENKTITPEKSFTIVK